MVVKWGGELTPLGLKIAQQAGEEFRERMYPKTGSDAGLLRLHSTYRHDLKLYSSDEGRVQMTAGVLEVNHDFYDLLGRFQILLLFVSSCICKRSSAAQW